MKWDMPPGHAPAIPATFDHVEKGKLLGGVDRVGGDRGGGRRWRRRRSREAAQPVSLPPGRDGEQLSHSLALSSPLSTEYQTN